MASKLSIHPCLFKFYLNTAISRTFIFIWWQNRNDSTTPLRVSPSTPFVTSLLFLVYCFDVVVFLYKIWVFNSLLQIFSKPWDSNTMMANGDNTVLLIK